jgi:hypothetical protein
MEKQNGSSGVLSTNTHVHVPPNFSSDTTLDQLLAQARSEGVRAVGTSNFFGMQVFPSFMKRAKEFGIHPLLGVEIITVDSELEEAGWTVNDPQNPGRYYLQGRALNADLVAAEASPVARAIRGRNDSRAVEQVGLLSSVLSEAGLPSTVTAKDVAAEVAERNVVPVEWVSLQERHISRAFADRLLLLGSAQRKSVLAKAFGHPPMADLDDAGSIQTELRSELMKFGQPAFVRDSPTSFADGYAMTLELGGFPVYCAVADGADPLCDYERPAEALARRLRERNIHAAELVTVRNTARCVDEYVSAFLAAGLLVTGGSEHNTPHRLPLALTCADGPLSDFASQAFWDGACVLAAHQELMAVGEVGFVDSAGEVAADRTRRVELAAYGAALLVDGV